jgi:hypothetical protein
VAAPFLFSSAMAKPIEKIRFSAHFEFDFEFGATYLKNDSKIVFVCGANSTEKCISNREKFLAYAEKHLGDFRFFRAEDVFNAFGAATMPDLLSIEDNLGDYSDCIIVLCESESAFAELGAFALSDSLVKQLLIINNEEFASSQSFINLGPIAKADKKSKFAPAVFADFEAILRSAPDIEIRLNKIPHQRRKKVLFENPPSFEKLSSKLKLLLLADLITLFSPLSQKELIEVLKVLFPSEKTFDVGVELALGQSLRFFSKEKLNDSDTYLVTSSKEIINFIDFFGLRRVAVRAQVIRAYFQGDRGRLKLLPDMEQGHE